MGRLCQCDVRRKSVCRATVGTWVESSSDAYLHTQTYPPCFYWTIVSYVLWGNSLADDRCLRRPEFVVEGRCTAEYPLHTFKQYVPTAVLRKHCDYLDDQGSFDSR